MAVFLKSNLVLFFVGGIVGTFLDWLQTYGGIAVYAHPFLWGTPRWVPLLFGGAVMVIGWSHYTFHPVGKHLKKSFYGSFLFLVLACFSSAFLKIGGLEKSLVILGLYLASFYLFDSTVLSFILALLTALGGCFTEKFVINTGEYHYVLPDIFGIPYWLPFLYLHVSQAAGYFGRVVLTRGLL